MSTASIKAGGRAPANPEAANCPQSYSARVSLRQPDVQVKHQQAQPGLGLSGPCILYLHSPTQLSQTLQWEVRGGRNILQVKQYLSFTICPLIITSRVRGGGRYVELPVLSEEEKDGMLKAARPGALGSVKGSCGCLAGQRHGR